MKRPNGIYALLCMSLFAFGHMIYHYPILPENVASHFSIHGEADGWMSKEVFMVFYVGFVAVTNLVFGGLSFAFSKLPASLINMPNKDYWLAPDKKEETLRLLSDFFLWFGAVTLTFLISMMHLTFRVNLDRSQALGNLFWLIIVAYVLFSIIWAMGLFLKFK